MPQFKYSVTFENPNSAAPATVRGEVTASSPGTALRRAFADARKEFVGKKADSVVVVLERI